MAIAKLLITLTLSLISHYWVKSVYTYGNFGSPILYNTRVTANRNHQDIIVKTLNFQIFYDEKINVNYEKAVTGLAGCQHEHT